MSTSQQKRKISEVEQGKLYKIAIDISQTKNKNYIEVPLVIPQEETPKNAEVSWFGFDTKKFYPIALYTADGRKASTNTVKDIRLFITIDYFSEFDHDEPSQSSFTGNVASSTNSCFWFTALRGYWPGTYRLTIKSYKHDTVVEPFVVSISCVANSDVKAPIMSLTSYAFNKQTSSRGTSSSSNVKTTTSTSSTSNNNKSSIGGLASTTTTLNPSATPLAIKAKIQGAVSASAALRASAQLATPRSEGTAVSRVVKNDYTEDEDDEEESGKNGTNGQVLTFPSQEIIDMAVQRIERPNIASLQLHGSVLKLSLPPALVTALLDDKSNVSLLLSASVKMTKNEKMNRNQELLEVIEKYNSPSVHDILFKLEKETKSTIGGGTEIFRTLRLAFESYLEKTVLYEVEKESEIYGRKIEQLKLQKRCLSTGFGAIFLLRFLVFLAVGIDAAELEMSAAENENTQQIENEEEDKDKDKTNAADGHAQSSMSRRRTLTYKHVTGAGAKMQEVVQYILKDLEKCAHFLFQ